nr:DUF6691 family protein [Pseudomonas yamanorum]
MTNPMKVLAFLDLAGTWDPSLGFVMVGAIAASSIPFYLSGKRTQSLLGAPIQLPTQKTIDRRLVLGSLTFGIGWGLVGLCPGPAIAMLLTGHWQVIVFFLAMVSGMALFKWLEASAKPNNAS